MFSIFFIDLRSGDIWTVKSVGDGLLAGIHLKPIAQVQCSELHFSEVSDPNPRHTKSVSPSVQSQMGNQTKVNRTANQLTAFVVLRTAQKR
jgi:hypothetical protein